VNFDRYLLRNGSPRAREWQYVHDRLFQIVEVRSSNGDGGQNSTGWLMRGGQWSAWQTNARGRLLLCRLGLASLYLPKPNDLRFAVKLAFYLAFVVLRNDRPTPLSCVIGPLLEAIGELPQAGTKTAGWTRFVVQRFNKAMRALDQARVIAVRRLPRQSEFRHVRGEAAQLRAWLASHVEIASAVTVAEVDG
jgi:hypothetical protein